MPKCLRCEVEVVPSELTFRVDGSGPYHCNSTECADQLKAKLAQAEWQAIISRKGDCHAT